MRLYFDFECRGAGRATKLRGLKAPDRTAAASAASAATVAAGSRGFLGAAPTGSSIPALFPTTGRTGGKGGTTVEGRGHLDGASGVLDADGDGDGDDSDDTGVRIGRAVAVEQAENNPTVGKVFRGEGATVAAKMAERQSGRRGKAESDETRTRREAERGGRSGGGDGKGRDRERHVEPPRKKVRSKLAVFSSKYRGMLR